MLNWAGSCREPRAIEVASSGVDILCSVSAGHKMDVQSFSS
jgi:hypothetical protein